MYKFEINLALTGDNEYAYNHHTLEEDLNYGIGWGWLTCDMLPTRELFSGSNACDLAALNPTWGRIARASKINAACVTPGYFLKQVDRAASRAYHYEIYLYRVTSKHGWLILSTVTPSGRWLDEYATPLPSASKMPEAIAAVAKAYGSIVARDIFGDVAIAKYCK